MHAGEKIICPHCGEKTLLKERKVFAGFQLQGTELVCLLCGHKVGDAPAPGANSPAHNASKSSKLAALLGETIPQKIQLPQDDSTGRFCLHCINFIEHPFKTMCGRTLKPTDPMAECPYFERKSEPEN